ncbi:MAG: hypothetical protein B6245_14240 [Desulfobacteraceae bacterium 4572_88]|nr:MAG: hypothetical protein B6245_14240 [Desulfobacteraceae bacterium 4572_88]
MEKRKMSVAFFVLCAFFLLSFATASALAEKIRIKKEGQEIFVFSANGTKAKSGSLSVRIRQNGDKAVLHVNGQRYAMKQKENKYKLRSPGGRVLLKVKVKPGKIRIYLNEDDLNSWSLKANDDRTRFKVRKGEKMVGKIKFYPEKKKVKVKKDDGGECCRVKTDRLRAAAVVCLMDELSEIERLLLFSILCIAGL